MPIKDNYEFHKHIKFRKIKNLISNELTNKNEVMERRDVFFFTQNFHKIFHKIAIDEWAFETKAEPFSIER